MSVAPKQQHRPLGDEGLPSLRDPAQRGFGWWPAVPRSSFGVPMMNVGRPLRASVFGMCLAHQAS